MANPHPTHRWQKGESGNARGREKCPEEIIDAKKFCRLDIQICLHALFIQPYIEIKSGLLDGRGPVLDNILASIIVGAVERGCKMRLNFLLNLIFGRKPSRIRAIRSKADATTGESGPFYAVELSHSGRFVHPRPRRVQCSTTPAM